MNKIVFKDIVAQFVNRVRLIPVAGDDTLRDVSPVRGTVTEAGTPVRAAELNAMQDNIEAAISAAESSANEYTDTQVGTKQDTITSSMALTALSLEAATITKSGKAVATEEYAANADAAILTAAENYTDTEILQEVENRKLQAASRLSGTATGTPSVTITDSAANSNFNAVTAKGVTTETGTGTKAPDNPYALSGKMPGTIRVRGKNWYPNNIVPYSAAAPTAGVAHLPKGTYTLSLQSVSNATSWRFLYRIFKNGTLITESNATPTHLTAVANGLFWQTSLQYYTWSGDNTTLTQIITTDDEYDLAWVLVAGNTTSSTVGNKPMIELGSSATAYEPYSGTDYAMSLSATMYSSSVYADTYDAVSGVETHNIGKKVFDGTETWSLLSTGSTYNIFIIAIAGKAQVLGSSTCSHFITDVSDYNAGGLGTISDRVANTYISLAVATTITTPADMKAWIAAQYAAGKPVTVMYKLASPTTTQHTAQTIPQPSLTANITADGAAVSVDYSKDLASALALKADKAQEAWITPTLVNGWTQYSIYTVGYRKDSFGRVKLRGAIQSGANGTIAFTLPAGYRPSQIGFYVGHSASGLYSKFFVDTSGAVTINSSTTYATLDEAYFDTL